VVPKTDLEAENCGLGFGFDLVLALRFGSQNRSWFGILWSRMKSASLELILEWYIMLHSG